MIDFSEIKKEMPVWAELKPLLPLCKVKSEEEAEKDNLEFINAVLSVLSQKTRLSTRLYWGYFRQNASKYNLRFTRWRKDGVWERLLPVFVKYEEYLWLGNPYVYSILLKDYKLLTLLNEFYLCNSTDVELTEDEVQQKLKKKFPKYMRNRTRRSSSSAKRHRGAYNVYSKEEKEFFRNLED